MTLNSKKKLKIGLLGGTFNPAHKGHLKISKEAKKRFQLNYVIWAITKKNPFKKKTSLSLKKELNMQKQL